MDVGIFIALILIVYQLHKLKGITQKNKNESETLENIHSEIIKLNQISEKIEKMRYQVSESLSTEIETSASILKTLNKILLNTLEHNRNVTRLSDGYKTASELQKNEIEYLKLKIRSLERDISKREKFNDEATTKNEVVNLLL